MELNGEVQELLSKLYNFICENIDQLYQDHLEYKKTLTQKKQK